ncbi:hypothetical protein [Aestuariimicrobium ganziense]|uniref:hypothetical protein n=1 Tax=Aestuariimicrobium ganziense TaxID=2773677 RepID=UPI0019452381|nr:hypothetical protein [Aestuariimicrobium ganziense]
MIANGAPLPFSMGNMALWGLGGLVFAVLAILRARTTPAPVHDPLAVAPSTAAAPHPVQGAHDPLA